MRWPREANSSCLRSSLHLQKTVEPIPVSRGAVSSRGGELSKLRVSRSIQIFRGEVKLLNPQLGSEPERLAQGLPDGRLRPRIS